SDNRFFQFEIRNAIPKQTSRFIIALEHRHGMSRFIELRGCGQSSRTTTDNGHLFPCPDQWWFGTNQPPLKRFLSNAFFDVLDGYRRLVDTEYTSRFTWGRADPAGKFREIVGAGKNFVCLLPVSPVHCVIEIRNDVPQGTSVVTER